MHNTEVTVDCDMSAGYRGIERVALVMLALHWNEIVVTNIFEGIHLAMSVEAGTVYVTLNYRCKIMYSLSVSTPRHAGEVIFRCAQTQDQGISGVWELESSPCEAIRLLV